MNTNQLKKFAKEARIKLITQIGVKLDFVLTQDTAELRGKSSELAQLRSRLGELGREQLIETVAYTWFNRLMALRFMDANGYNTPKVVTPLPGMSNPEILQNALAGNVEEDLKLDRQRLNDLIDGRTSSSDAQTEAFKLLLVASCNKWHTAMPFMFERISDYTELLLPDDLLSDFSIVSDIRNGMSDEDCQQEELIGWLYQFYISDKKDDVFEGLKKNVKITAENIPAATQLFTPRWIVRYMVENTLGKLWLTFKPESKLRQHMPYFIEISESNKSLPLPEGISGIKDITFLDPCQGSGHVLVYAFDLLTKIYEEEGYNSNEIPSLILENNLFGIDIDERAAQLASFALTMKSRKFYTRFLRNPVRPRVLALENIGENIIEEAVKLPLAVGGKLVYHYKDLSLYNLTKADNFGSLIQIDPEELKALSIQNGSMWQGQEQKLKEQAEYLSRQYHCVVTNPPYMGAKGMNKDLKSFIDYNYKEGKSDLMTCFMLRCSNLIYPNCSYGMINLPSWLFLSSFDDLRKIILKEQHIDSMLHMGRGIFGIDFGSVAFIISKSIQLWSGKYFRLHQRNFQHIHFQHIEQLFLMAKNNFEYKFDFNEYRDDAGILDIPIISNENGSKIYYKANQSSFSKIPGSPIGYWLGDTIIDLFENSPTIKSQVEARQGMATGDNEKFIRNWSEVAFNNIGFEINSIDEAFKSGKRFFPYNKGGDYRRWYGNQSYVIKFSQTDYEVLKSMGNHCPSQQFYFQPSVSWARIGSGLTSFRYYPKGFLFDQSGHSIFQDNLDNVKYLMSFLNTTTYEVLTKAINPTLNLEVGNIGALPFPKKIASNSNSMVDTLIEISKSEWDSKELSWNFKQNELIKGKIPVIVSMGDVAASGGYYIACGADSIYADANTITGSIGVFSVVPNISGFMKNKLGVTFDGVKTATYADAPTSTRPLNTMEQKMMQSGVDSIYNTFKSRVAKGRKKSMEFVDSIAQGRVWLGSDAINVGLVDRIGTLNDALASAAKMAKLKGYSVKQYPESKSFIEDLIEDYKDFVKVKSIESEIGASQWQILQHLKTVQQMVGAPQARMPIFVVKQP